MRGPLFSPDFQAPEVLETDMFRLRTLTVNDVVKDYDAVITSQEDLQGLFGPRSNWPPLDLTLEQDLIDLGWHQKEFQMHSSFAYTVVTLDESRCLGCVYILPPTKEGFDAEVYMWVRKVEVRESLDSYLYFTVRQWIATKWPVKKAAYPGRDIDWATWESMP